MLILTLSSTKGSSSFAGRTNPTPSHNMLEVFSFLDSDCGLRISFDRIQLLYRLWLSSPEKILKNLSCHWSSAARFVGAIYFLKYYLFVGHRKFLALFHFVRLHRRDSFTRCRTVSRLMFNLFACFLFETLCMHPFPVTPTFRFLEIISAHFLPLFRLSLLLLNCQNFSPSSDTA